MTIKIEMKNPLVEMDGDEMTRVLWQMIKEILITPYLQLKTKYFDLGLRNRERTADRVTREAAEAIKNYGVGVKCATITPNAERVKEYGLREIYKSPNGTIRAILDGTVFREPILVPNIKPLLKNWTQPITIARHAYGDIYKDVEQRIEYPGKVELVFTPDNGEAGQRELIHNFSGPGVVLGMHNLDSSIVSFARACFHYAWEQKKDLWFATKDTISKKYDHTFKDIFAEIYTKEYQKKFESAGIKYFYTLIDDAVARLMHSAGGMVLACKNYDGDVLSDLVASAFGSLALMTSVLVSPQGEYLYEAAHGTVQKHYYRYLKGENTSTNPIATIFAWSGALAKRGELDCLPELITFARSLEKATIETVEAGYMTMDLAAIADSPAQKVKNTSEFLAQVESCLTTKL